MRRSAQGTEELVVLLPETHSDSWRKHEDLMARIFLLFAVIVLILSSCEDAFFEDDRAEDPIANFEYLCTIMNERYSLFEFKHIDWDSINDVYRPQVQAETSHDELFEILADMLNSLRDGHTNLWSPIDISRHFPY